MFEYKDSRSHLLLLKAGLTCERRQASDQRQQAAVASSASTTPSRSAARTRAISSAGSRLGTCAHSSSPNRSTTLLAPLLSRVAPPSSVTRRLPVSASAAAAGPSSFATQKPPGWLRFDRNTVRASSSTLW